jgi:GntR family transcriptional repressor for pyruvate dehydrogenase complex
MMTVIKMEPIEKIELIDQIIDTLTKQIVEGRLKPGDKIPGERTLSEILNVSRTSIRQALKALEFLGVLDIRHGSTTTLNTSSANLFINPLKFMSILYNVKVPELFEARKVIEVELAKMAARNASDEDIENMRRCLEKAKDNFSNPEVFLYAEKDFHGCIFIASRNRILMAMITSLNTLVTGSRMESIKTFSTLEDSYDEHYRIFEAIEKRDIKAAGKAMMDHLVDVEKRLESVQGRQ